MRALIAMAAVIFLFAASAIAGDPKPTPPPTVTWATTLPAIELTNRPLEKVLNELKAKMPGFNFTISRENVPHDYPILPAMSVENVALGDFFQLIARELNGVQVTMDAGPDGRPFVRLTITGPVPDAPAPIVRIFGLGDIIAYRSTFITAGPVPDREKQAANDILSLIQAALDLVGEKPQPVMKFHAPTQTLLFKGTASQADIAASALAALQPTVAGRTLRGLANQDDFDRLAAENRQLKDELQTLRATTRPAR